MPRTPHVAYFCMEFGLHESFPIYSGGLGVLAGDFIKSAADLKLPVIGVGLLWEHGYSVQRIGPDGQPFEEFPRYDYSFLRDTGVHVRVNVRGAEVPCNVWVTTRFGHVPLYLIQPSRPADRWITHRLYEAGTDVRIAQEMLLGIGGARALTWLGIPVATHHFNEGHAVFAGVEMIAARMEAGLTFPDAWAATRREIVFTTHTPVKAGNEEHSLKDLRRMGACLQLSGAEMRAIGGDPFNMTVAGLRLSRMANAVASLHGETARTMWKHITDAAPIISVTNGVHVPTWQSPLVRAAAGDPARLWDAHTLHRGRAAGRDRAAQGPAARPGGAHHRLRAPGGGLQAPRPDRAGREAPRGPARAAACTSCWRASRTPTTSSARPSIARLVAAERTHPGQVVYLENYDMALGRMLTRGCDVWLNNPVRPLEASGTSGMKAAMNGVLNLSILDGWWPEGCEHGVNGWAIGDGESGDDARDLAALYEVLEGEVLPAWADRARWVAMMQASITMGVEKFSSDRMLRDYFAKLYPAGETRPVEMPGVAPANR